MFAIRVDTLSKVVIIAIGGKIGNPLLLASHTSEQGQKKPPTAMLYGAWAGQ